MRNYVSPIVEKILYNEQDVITSSGGTQVFGTDNGVFWPGWDNGGSTNENE